jgi:hypothetical protein
MERGQYPRPVTFTQLEAIRSTYSFRRLLGPPTSAACEPKWSHERDRFMIPGRCFNKLAVGPGAPFMRSRLRPHKRDARVGQHGVCVIRRQASALCNERFTVDRTSSAHLIRCGGVIAYGYRKYRGSADRCGVHVSWCSRLHSLRLMKAVGLRCRRPHLGVEI